MQQPFLSGHTVSFTLLLLPGSTYLASRPLFICLIPPPLIITLPHPPAPPLPRVLGLCLVRWRQGRGQGGRLDRRREELAGGPPWLAKETTVCGVIPTPFFKPDLLCASQVSHLVGQGLFSLQGYFYCNSSCTPTPHLPLVNTHLLVAPQVTTLKKLPQKPGKAWAWCLWECTLKLPEGAKAGDKLTLVCKAIDDNMSSQVMGMLECRIDGRGMVPEPAPGQRDPSTSS